MARYLSQLDTADRQEPSEALVAKTEQHAVPGMPGRLDLRGQALDRASALSENSRRPESGCDMARNSERDPGGLFREGQGVRENELARAKKRSAIHCAGLSSAS